MCRIDEVNITCIKLYNKRIDMYKLNLVLSRQLVPWLTLEVKIEMCVFSVDFGRNFACVVTLGNVCMETPSTFNIFSYDHCTVPLFGVK